MSQYKTGTVSVTNGSQVVTGTGTAWLSNVQPGDGFTVAGTQVPYTVGSVDSDGQITLSAAYAGASGSGLAYAIWRDFEQVTGAPELSHGDIETATIFTRAIRKIGQAIGGIIPAHVSEANPHNQYILNSEYEKAQLREALLKEATLNLDFANNKYEVYEGPVASLTQRPFNDVLNFSRSSAAYARNATGGLTEVLADQQRLVGNREGLLVEEQRTNLQPGSSDFVTGWTQSPSGSFTNDTWIPSTGVTEGCSCEASTTSAPVTFRSFASFGSVFCYSAEFKKASVDDYANILIDAGGGTNGVRVWFDLSVGQAVRVQEFGSGVSLIAAKVEPLRNGSFRLSVAVNRPTDETMRVLLRPTISTDGGFNATVGSVGYVALGQAEVGAFPTSHIKTEGSQVTRGVETSSRLLSEEFNSGGFTLFSEFICRGVGSGAAATPFVVEGTGGAASNAVLCGQIVSSGLSIRVLSLSFQGASYSSSVTIPGGILNKRIRTAVSFNSETLEVVGVAAIDGSAYTRNTTLAEAPLGLDEVFIGSLSGGQRINGELQRVGVIPRALTAVELETLTS